MQRLKVTLIIALLFSFTALIHAQSYLRIYYPDIEQGASSVIVSPTGKAVVLDAGTGMNSTEIPIEGFINDLIDAGIITSVEYTIATHYDEDHIGRFENVFQYVDLAPGLIAYDRGTYLSVPTTFAYGDYSWQAGLHNRTTITPNTSLDLGGGVTVRCYVVNGNLPDGTSVDITSAGQFENAASVAVVVRYGDFDTWIGGDLTDNPTYSHPPVESSVAPFIGDMDIYTVNHHGSLSTSSNATFLNSIKAEVAINQNSSNNSHGHPNATIVSRILGTNDTFGNTPKFFQTNPGDPDDTRSDDSLADGIADPDDVNGAQGLPGAITVISDGGSYQVFGGAIEPLAKLADSGTHTMADFPAAILQTYYSPVVPTNAESVTVSSEIRDENAITAVISYSLDGVAQTDISMTKVGGTNRYEGTIAAQANGTLVEFRVKATDNQSQVTLSRKQGYFAGTTDIADIRGNDADEVMNYKGYSARVRGNMTVEPGIFHTYVSQIYVQDTTGGINIFDSSLLPINRGDDVSFVGKIDQFAGAAQIVIAEAYGNYGYTNHGAGTTPTPIVATVAQINESYEGKLVRINGVSLTATSDPMPGSGNGSITITDDGEVSTLTLRVDGDTDIPGSNTPVGSFDIIGIVSQFDSSVPLNWGYQIVPREKTDFVTEEVNHPAVIISEIHADPDGTLGDANGDGVVSSTQDEFVEVVNTTLDYQDISGWVIADGNSDRFTFPANTILPPHEAAVVFSGGTPTGDFGNCTLNGFVFTAGSLGLNNSGDTVTLKNDSAVTIQAVVYGSEGGDNQSLVRNPDWTNAPMVKHTTTASGLRYSPGANNSGDAYTLAPGLLYISEVLYDPTGADGDLEWIELYNASDATINLDGLSIGGGGSTYMSTQFDLTGSVAAGATFVIGGSVSSADNGNPTFDMSFNFSPDLQNSGSTADGVALFNVDKSRVTSSTIPIDAVVYGTTNSNNLLDVDGLAATPHVADAPQGSSIERIDFNGGWQVQGSPDPNNANISTSGGGSGSASDVIISEVFYDVSGSDNGYEWVELYNKGANPVDLSTMSLGAGGSDYTTTTAQLSGTIQPGQTYVIGGSTSNSSNANPSYDLVLNFSPDLQNSGSPGDGVALFDVLATAITSATVPIDAVVFGSNNNSNLIDESGSANAPEVGDAPAGSSIERTSVAGAWQIQASPDPNNVTF